MSATRIADGSWKAAKLAAVAQTPKFSDEAKRSIRGTVTRNQVKGQFLVAIRWRLSGTDERDGYPNALPLKEMFRIGRDKNGSLFAGDYLAPWDTAVISGLTMLPGNERTDGRTRILLTVRFEEPIPAPSTEGDENDGDDYSDWFGVRTLADAMGDEK